MDSDKTYYQNNREYILLRQKKYNRENWERIKEYQRLYWLRKSSGRKPGRPRIHPIKNKHVKPPKKKTIIIEKSVILEC